MSAAGKKEKQLLMIRKQVISCAVMKTDMILTCGILEKIDDYQVG